MTTTNLLCASPIEGLVVRIILTNSCGVPLSGVGSGMLVMDGFTQVQDSPQYDIGDRKMTRKANGTLCQNFKLPDQFTNDDLTIDFCSWNPAIVPALLSGRLLTATSSPTGTGFAHGTWSNATQAHWSLELWQAPPQDCAGSSTVYYPYHAWPHLSNAKRGDTTHGLDSSILQIMASTMDSSSLWSPVGLPYLGASQVVNGDHYLYNLESTAPPPAACSYSTYPS
jgi:hypothetical protein